MTKQTYLEPQKGCRCIQSFKNLYSAPSR